VLQIRAYLQHEEEKLRRLIEALAQLAERHRETLMAGRTHSQQALPITFGFKAANWLAPLLRHGERLKELKPRLLALQFGGGVGTLSVLGDRGVEAQEALADALGLGAPPMPWHNQRDSMAELAGWLSMLSGSLGKMAQDIILMSQSEVGEVSEAAGGGSSTMPQKHNPIQSELILGAARQNAALLAAMHQALIQDHERGTQGWQLELLSLPQMLALTSSALQKAIALIENLRVHEKRMRANVEASRGVMLAEALSMALSAHMPRKDAAQMVKEASQVAVREKRYLPDVVREKVNLELDWDRLKDEANHLGSAQQFIDRALREAQGLKHKPS
jgi:3-carboxy-cis,cis-muconate cycloisomerase